jgi:uncharacterized membrane protein
VAIAAGLGVLGALAALLQLFWGQDIGLADNGDGFRLMCHFDLVRREDVLAERVVFHYAPVTYGCEPNLAYMSSQQWLVRPALWIYGLRYESGFDLRALGILHSTLFGVLLAGLYLALPGRRLVRVLTVVVAGLLLADVTFVTYFVSPFSEPATFLGLLAVVAATAWYVRDAGSRRLSVVLLTCATAFLMVAKSQTVVLALLVAPVLLSRRVEVGSFTGRWRGRAVPGVACVVLLATGVGHLLQQPPFFAQVNNHNVVFYTLLVESSDPGAVLRSLGVSEDLVRYQGIGYFDPRADGKEDDPQYQQFLREVDRSKVLRYLASHPGQWPRLLEAGTEAVAEVRQDYLSNYPTARRDDAILAPRPNPTERLLGSLHHLSWPLFPIVWLMALVVGAVAMFRRSAGTEARAVGAVCYLLGATALSQVVVAVAGDGYYELVKHTVLSGYATALLLAVAAGALVSAWGGRRRRRPTDGPAAGAAR